MQVEVKVPQLSESVSEATLVAWRKKPGEAVKRDENLIDVETDKGIGTATVQGTGRDGRVTKADVMGRTGEMAAMPTAAKPAPLPIQLPTGDRTEQRVAMSRLRQRIAERLVQSQSTAAILTTFNEVNMAPVMELRNRYKEKFEKEHGVKLGFMSFFVKAAVHALRKFPVVNASIDGTDIIYHGYYDIGIAVGTERGLLVPILRSAHALSSALLDQPRQYCGRGGQA